MLKIDNVFKEIYHNNKVAMVVVVSNMVDTN